MQIIQKDIDIIDILLILDNNLKDKTNLEEIIIDNIQKYYDNKFGQFAEINVKKVTKISSSEYKPKTVVVSNVKPQKILDIIESLIKN